MNDETETIRRLQLVEINAEPGSREALEVEHGQVWDTRQLGEDFIVEGFLAHTSSSAAKADGQRGSLMFQHNPRFYFVRTVLSLKKGIEPMMSIEVLVAVNNEIARKAAKQGLVPFVPFSPNEVESPFSFPNIGTLKPRGWVKTSTTWFVDKTGHGDMGARPDLAAVPPQLAGYILRHPRYGFAITEEGEFQVVVSAFRRI